MVAEACEEVCVQEGCEDVCLGGVISPALKRLWWQRWYGVARLTGLMRTGVSETARGLWATNTGVGLLSKFIFCNNQWVNIVSILAMQ